MKNFLIFTFMFFFGGGGVQQHSIQAYIYQESIKKQCITVIKSTCDECLYLCLHVGPRQNRADYGNVCISLFELTGQRHVL